MRTTLGISRAQQIVQHNSNKDVQDRMGMPVLLGDNISSCRLHWSLNRCWLVGYPKVIQHMV